MKNVSGLLPILVALSLFIFTACDNGTTDRDTDQKHILFIAGAPSHGFGNHEHLGGSTLLAQTIIDANVGVTAQVVSGWPEDPAIFDKADAVVIYSNGGPGHPIMGNLDTFQEVMDRGVGFVTLHYAVEVPIGEAGEKFLDWQGGYFETDWTVNPFWTADFDELPNHPITNGVSPFSIRDEWYYHMRFADDVENIAPILTDLPPAETLDRDDGPHSNNPHVREAVLENEEPQHVAWAYERADGGRAFGFTGGHYHWNWGHDQFRKVVANAIVWASGADVPENGLPIEPITVLELSELTDDPTPDEWNHQEWQEMLDEANNRY